MDSRPHMLVASLELAIVLVARDRRYDYPGCSSGAQIGLFAKLKLMNSVMRARHGKPCWVYCCPLIGPCALTGSCKDCMAFGFSIALKNPVLCFSPVFSGRL